MKLGNTSHEMWDKEEKLQKQYMGFQKLKGKIAKQGKVSDPAAVAAAVGRKKYGKAGFQALATAGKRSKVKGKKQTAKAAQRKAGMVEKRGAKALKKSWVDSLGLGE